MNTDPEAPTFHDQVVHIEEQVIALAATITAIATTEAPARTEDDIQRLVDAARQLGEAATTLAGVTETIADDFAWWNITENPEIIARTAPVLTWSGFQTLGAFYRILQDKGILPEGMSAGDLTSWFQTVQDPVAEHIAARESRQVLWRQEGSRWTLSFLSSPEAREDTDDREPEPLAAPPPRAVPVAAPAAALPEAPPKPAPPNPEKSPHEPAFTPEEINLATAIVTLLSELNTTEQLRRPALLAGLHKHLDIPRKQIPAFDKTAKTLIKRLVQRGHLEEYSIKEGGFRHKLPGELRAAWRKGQRDLLTRLAEDHRL